MALYLLLVEDGNGESEIVGMWFLRDETSDMIKSAVSAFCSDNPDYSRVKCVMADKDFIETEAFSAAFPNAAVHICFFHTLRNLSPGSDHREDVDYHLWCTMTSWQLLLLLWHSILTATGTVCLMQWCTDIALVWCYFNTLLT